MPRKSPNPTGRPPLERAYDFSAHLDHLARVLPHLSRTFQELHALCAKSMKDIKYRQFARQLRGLANYNRNLPGCLEDHVRLADYGITATHWLDLPKFIEALPKRNSIASAGQQLRDMLEAWQKRSRMKILTLAPAAIEPRQIGKYDPDLPVRHAGPHRMRYRATAANGTTIHLLLLEHDENRGRWICANRVPDIGFPVNEPRSSAGSLPLDITPSPGVFAIFAVAGASPFGQNLCAAIDNGAVGPEGVMSDKALAAVVASLNREAKQDRVVGMFRYCVPW